MQLKSLNEQVVVITGASSGIGRETALRFAQRGAKVVALARGEEGLASLVSDITAQGGDAVYAICDVADFAQVEAAAETAVQAFGRIDTWVNNAAVAIYARFEETSVDEFRRLMDINFMGQVNGAKAALPHLRREGRGALIAISSVEGMVPMPLHSAYSASKHAVEGVFGALRRELLEEGVPISVTSIKPAAINTPFFTNARNKMDVKPQGPPPVYQPDVVADCILYAAEHPVRDLFAGGGGKVLTTSQMLTPTLVDAALARFGIKAQRTDEPPTTTEGNLYEPRGDNRVEGDFGAKARRLSVYTWLETHPMAGMVLSTGLLAETGLLLARRDDRE